MTTKRPPKTGKPAQSVPKPNISHPVANLVPFALQQAHAHPLSYHAFLKSRYTPQSEPSTATKGKRKASSMSTGLQNAVPNAVEASVVQRKLLLWFDGVKDTRGMPWRKEVDPAKLSEAEQTQRAYEVWVSEIMLQQTQVATVIKFFNNWIAKLPTIESLAKADPELVNECWKGLGYYSRATRLQTGAQKVVKQFKGRIPSTAQDLLEIDGIGPYSAGAISSIAFAQRSPMVDGNIQRVLSRLTALHAPATAKSTTSFIWALADVLVPSQKDGQKEALKDVGGPNKPGAWNQAMMELGATVCTPKNPECHACPLSEECLAYAEVRYVTHERKTLGNADVPDIEECSICSPIDDFDPREHSVTVYPMAKERKKPREEETAVCILEWIRKGADHKRDPKQVLLVKRPDKGLLAGLYEFPSIDLTPSEVLSTPKQRRKELNKVLATLLKEPVNLDQKAETSPHGLVIRSVVELQPIKQVYSHQIRTYWSTKVVVESNDLPKLCSPSSSANVEAYGVGRCKWIGEEDVANSNTGGAVGKIWDERERLRQGLPSTSSSKKGSQATKKKPSINGGSTLDGWMKISSSESSKNGTSTSSKPGRKPMSPTKKKRRMTKDGYETDSSGDVDAAPGEIVIVDDEVNDEFVPSSNYKKRTIAVSSDEEDQ
ncbi:hypothetical protein OIO90_004543 [Microbotryomycetes sp. JL221]|nr:hypothetical protein OIO90_004543 [Microbotryomycetes sp. JL221]